MSHQYLTRTWLRNLRHTFLTTRWNVGNMVPTVPSLSPSPSSSSPSSVSSSSSTLHLVIGNEACDCDSVISSITWAWYLSRVSLLSPLSSSSSSTSNSSPPLLILPVISCSRKDWTLRREAQYLLNRYVKEEDNTVSMDPSTSAASVIANDNYDWTTSLVFIDEVMNLLFSSSSVSTTTISANPTNPNEALSTNSLRITLVDHNELKGPLATYPQLYGNVYEIIDHHLDTNKHTHVKNEKRYIEYDPVTRTAVGSTCTLVAHRLLQLRKNTAITDNKPPYNVIDASLAKLLGSVIILDTVGLDSKAGRTTALDTQIIQELNDIIINDTSLSVESSSASVASSEITENGFHVPSIFKTLMNLKTEEKFWKSLSIQQALEFDYKMFTLPLPSILAEEIRNTIENGEQETIVPASVSFGTSSIMVPLTKFLSNWRPSTPSESSILMLDTERAYGLQNFLQGTDTTHPLSFEVILSMTTEGDTIQRELAFLCRRNRPDVHIVERVLRSLRKNIPSSSSNGYNDVLQLEEYTVTHVPDSLYVRVFRQHNVKASRKQVVPLIMDTFDGK